MGEADVFIADSGVIRIKGKITKSPLSQVVDCCAAIYADLKLFEIALIFQRGYPEIIKAFLR